ncbi:MAG: hypothetical protein MJK04_10690, partial [Psychrosphaera sp.]|nr:hypothetical protein [Psychrosphaera sp.]
GGGNGGGNPPPGGGGGGGGNPPPPGDVNAQLRNIIDQRNLNVDPTTNRNLPNINDIMAQLGKSLFFAKNLGGQDDASCASCHHPTLGGGDNLSLPVGVDAVDSFDADSPDLLGHGRFHDNNNGNRPVIGRNSPTVFNIGLIDRGLFWDSRVEAINPTQGSNGTADAIVTPDSIVNANGRRQPDQNLPQGTSLPAAQARFPVTSNSEMRGQFAAGDDNQSLRAQLSARFDNSNSDYDTGWPVLFNQAYPDGEINFNRIAEAIGEYERSMTFINNPWTAYLRGDDTAMTDQQKSGAVLFFTPRNRGGGGCAGCHNGPTFSDGRHHLTAFPQIGPGAGDDSGAGVNDDFGREHVTGNERDRYHFRTASLLNVAATGPYGHSGAYETLDQVVRHYSNPRRSVDRLFGVVEGEPYAANQTALCQSPQVAGLIDKNGLDCADVYPAAFANSQAALARLGAARNDRDVGRAPLRGNARLNNGEVQELVAFLEALTDPCVLDRECLQPWIIDDNDTATYPDDNPLIGKDAQGDAL